MPLFKRKPDVTVEVSTATVVAGEVLRARASFGEPDGKTRAARIELVYRNTYREDHHDNEHGTQTRTVTSTVRVDVQDVPLGDAPDAEVELLVPPDAPGTAENVIAWEVRAVIDRKMARDAVAKAEITVLTPATQHPSWASAPAETTVPWPISVEVPSRVARAGDPIMGHLRFTPSEELKVRAVRVQLRSLRLDPDRNKTANDGTRVELLGASTFPAGQTQQLPFEIHVPADAAPTFRAEHNHHHWYLEGILDQRLSKDPRVISEIVVHTG
ncbi:MAG: hypothetical protein AB7G37_18980 [Solirubrobacteraceae bacterium]